MLRPNLPVDAPLRSTFEVHDKAWLGHGIVAYFRDVLDFRAENEGTYDLLFVAEYAWWFSRSNPAAIPESKR